MDEPTSNELAAAGVETDVPSPHLPRMAFEEVAVLRGTDRKLRLQNGMELRERLIRRPHEGGFNIAISNALLDEDGKVARDGEGAHRIHPLPHEVSFSGAALATLGSKEKIEAALLAQREIAAAQAHAFFTGMDLGTDFFADRLA